MQHLELQVSLSANPVKSNRINFKYRVNIKGSVMNKEIPTLEIRNTCLALNFEQLIGKIY